jgi:hypothetical protein
VFVKDYSCRLCRGLTVAIQTDLPRLFLSSVQRLVPRPHSSICQVYIKPHCQFLVLSSVFFRGFLLTPTI